MGKMKSGLFELEICVVDIVRKAADLAKTDKFEVSQKNDIVNIADYHNIMNNKATREQFAEILANSLPDNGLYPINNIADNAIPDIRNGDRYGNSIYKLYRAGILTGNDVLGNFSPKSYITRAEVATIVSRIADSDNRVNFSLN